MPDEPIDPRSVQPELAADAVTDPTMAPLDDAAGGPSVAPPEEEEAAEKGDFA